jgi:dTDP-4-amino-4,6-dideoxygalactose transaminase
MNERMDGLQAAFLSTKLAHLHTWQAERDRLFARYEAQLTNITGLQVLDCNPKAVRVHHLLPVFVENRDAVLQGLHDRQVGAAIHYPHPMHLLPPGSQCGKPGRFPVSERLTSTTLTLPLYPGMSDAQVDYCVSALEEAMEAAR